MDLGLAFEDEDLSSNTRQIRDDTNLPYNVKLCTPLWFESTLESHHSGQPDSPDSKDIEVDPERLPHMLKSSGDYHYLRRNYEKAAQQYERALDLLPDTNVTVRQDVRESMARCYLYSGRPDKSLQLARELVCEMANEDEARQRQSLMLLSSVCEKAGRWAECVDSLEKLCILQPYFAQSWQQLGDAYEHLYHCASTSVTSAEAVPVENTVRLLTCYIRASLLLQSVIGTASHLVKSRNQALITQMSKRIDELSCQDSMKTFAYERIQREIGTQAHDPKDVRLGQDLDHSVNGLHSSNSDGSSSSFFYQRFCSWYFKQASVDNT